MHRTTVAGWLRNWLGIPLRRQVITKVMSQAIELYKQGWSPVRLASVRLLRRDLRQASGAAWGCPAGNRRTLTAREAKQALNNRIIAWRDVIGLMRHCGSTERGPLIQLTATRNDTCASGKLVDSRRRVSSVFRPHILNTTYVCPLAAS